MLSLIIALTVSADVVRSPVGVAPTSKRPGVEKLNTRIASRVAEVLVSEGLDGAIDVSTTGQRLKKAGIADPTTCAAGQQCALRLAALLGPHAVLVAIDVSKFGSALDIRLEALAADAPSPIATADLSVEATKWKEGSASAFTAFAKELKAHLVVKEEPRTPPPEPPPPVVLTPRETPAPPAVVERPSSSRRVIGFALVGTAAVAAVGAIIFGVLADRKSVV
jgi:hypothetical protein